MKEKKEDFPSMDQAVNERMQSSEWDEQICRCVFSRVRQMEVSRKNRNRITAAAAALVLSAGSIFFTMTDRGRETAANTYAIVTGSPVDEWPAQFDSFFNTLEGDTLAGNWEVFFEEELWQD